VKKLEGKVRPEGLVLDFIDGTHPAFAQAAKNAIHAEFFPDDKCFATVFAKQRRRLLATLAAIT
jgi:hypothetical protein